VLTLFNRDIIARRSDGTISKTSTRTTSDERPIRKVINVDGSAWWLIDNLQVRTTWSKMTNDEAIALAKHLSSYSPVVCKIRGSVVIGFGRHGQEEFERNAAWNRQYRSRAGRSGRTIEYSVHSCVPLRCWFSMLSNATAAPSPSSRNIARAGGISLQPGRPTQRIGIIPDIEVKPTIAGIRAGRDEVLEEALRQILGAKTPPAQIEALAKP
jgi:hypothetical protein